MSIYRYIEQLEPASIDDNNALLEWLARGDPHTEDSFLLRKARLRLRGDENGMLYFPAFKLIPVWGKLKASGIKGSKCNVAGNELWISYFIDGDNGFDCIEVPVKDALEVITVNEFGRDDKVVKFKDDLVMEINSI